MRANEETRRLFLSAAKSNQFDSAIDYGQQLANAKAAQPSDLAIIAQSYLSIGDCENAQLWAGTADDAFRSTGLAPDESLHRVSACCATGRNRPPANLDAAQRAHIDQLLSGSGAAKAATGGSLVRLGELYYGYGEYELAIAAIQLGLKKGKVAHLDEAYVYLGRAEQALGKIDEARAAFGQLKDVPGINPRVLRLWTLYAETQLSESAIGQCAPKSG